MALFFLSTHIYTIIYLMPTEFIFLLIVVLAGFIILYLAISRKLEQKPKTDQTLANWLQSLQASMNSNNQNLSTVLQRSYHELHERLDKATAVIGDLKKEAGAFSEVGRSMRDLSDFLKSPKLRGNIGEQVLKDLIAQMFPKNSFNLQYSFKSGAIVDAAIKTDAGIIPIDSKFPMENFQKMVKAEAKSDRDSYQTAFLRDVKKHIKDISAKYILPAEGTMDFALMYIPSESVYYEISGQTELLDYARENRVYPVSPTTLYAHLQTILLSFEGKKIETKSREVFALLRGIQKDYGKLEGNLGTLNRHLTNAYNQMSLTNQAFQSLGQKISSTHTLDQASASKPPLPDA